MTAGQTIKSLAISSCAWYSLQTCLSQTAQDFKGKFQIRKGKKQLRRANHTQFICRQTSSIPGVTNCPALIVLYAILYSVLCTDCLLCASLGRKCVFRCRFVIPNSEVKQLVAAHGTVAVHFCGVAHSTYRTNSGQKYLSELYKTTCGDGRDNLLANYGFVFRADAANFQPLPTDTICPKIIKYGA